MNDPAEMGVSGRADPVGRRRAWLALALLVPAPSLGTAAGLFWWPGEVGQGVFLAAKVWLVVFPAFWWLKVEGGRWSWSPPRRGGFGPAILLGVVISAVILGVYALVSQWGWIEPEMVAGPAQKAGLAEPGVYLAGAVYWVTLNSLMEEYVWRWFVFRQWERLVGGMAAVGLAALCFTLHHIVALAAYFPWPVVMLGSLGVFAGGAIWSGLYLRYRSIWPGYLSHAIVDVPIFLIGWWLIFGQGG
ncbi:MAG: CPBP family intramembrane metalloprotease [Verrucomicrobia bacterium]|nr:MAG: CPBP family intramembrane metalloprotease [Verrucomicrobiota bacterium]